MPGPVLFDEVLLRGAEGITAVDFNRGQHRWIGRGSQDHGILHLRIADGTFGFGFQSVDGQRAGGVEVGADQRGLIAVAADAVEHGDSRQIRQGHARAGNRAIAGDIRDRLIVLRRSRCFRSCCCSRRRIRCRERWRLRPCSRLSGNRRRSDWRRCRRCAGCRSRPSATIADLSCRCRPWKSRSGPHSDRWPAEQLFRDWWRCLRPANGAPGCDDDSGGHIVVAVVEGDGAVDGVGRGGKSDSHGVGNVEAGTGVGRSAIVYDRARAAPLL